MYIDVIALIISIISAAFAYRQNTRLNNINMNSEYYHDIFDDFLINRIPMGLKYLNFVNDKLVDQEKLTEALTDLLTAALYFKYQDKLFYDRLKKIAQDLEDYVLECGNKKYVQEEQAEVFSNIHTKIENLYKCINENYMGK